MFAFQFSFCRHTFSNIYLFTEQNLKSVQYACQSKHPKPAFLDSIARLNTSLSLESIDPQNEHHGHARKKLKNPMIIALISEVLEKTVSS